MQEVAFRQVRQPCPQGEHVWLLRKNPGVQATHRLELPSGRQLKQFTTVHGRHVVPVKQLPGQQASHWVALWLQMQPGEAATHSPVVRLVSKPGTHQVQKVWLVQTAQKAGQETHWLSWRKQLGLQMEQVSSLSWALMEQLQQFLTRASQETQTPAVRVNPGAQIEHSVEETHWMQAVVRQVTHFEGPKAGETQKLRAHCEQVDSEAHTSHAQTHTKQIPNVQLKYMPGSRHAWQLSGPVQLAQYQGHAWQGEDTFELFRQKPGRQTVQLVVLALTTSQSEQQGPQGKHSLSLRVQPIKQEVQLSANSSQSRQLLLQLRQAPSKRQKCGRQEEHWPGPAQVRQASGQNRH